ncbi:hypothetical protein C8J57DRAFT_1537222 [Mycena rebaudengoi]|nr:hypothetical protein C8J57DRAFT_1537222 [Mycena rebaudengoi]
MLLKVGRELPRNDEAGWIVHDVGCPRLGLLVSLLNAPLALLARARPQQSLAPRPASAPLPLHRPPRNSPPLANDTLRGERARQSGAAERATHLLSRRRIPVSLFPFSLPLPSGYISIRSLAYTPLYSSPYVAGFAPPSIDSAPHPIIEKYSVSLRAHVEGWYPQRLHDDKTRQTATPLADARARRLSLGCVRSCCASRAPAASDRYPPDPLKRSQGWRNDRRMLGGWWGGWKS